MLTEDEKNALVKKVCIVRPIIFWDWLRGTSRWQWAILFPWSYLVAAAAVVVVVVGGRIVITPITTATAITTAIIMFIFAKFDNGIDHGLVGGRVDMKVMRSW